MLMSAESQVPKLISRKFFFAEFHACDHNPPTLQMDRQRIMAIPCYATLRAVKMVDSCI